MRKTVQLAGNTTSLEIALCFDLWRFIMAWKNEEEADVVITAVTSVGSQVSANGIIGFIDQVKHTSWWSNDVDPPQIGDHLHAVVLDDTRDPPRLSALQSDIDIARVLREREKSR
ncbi:hypothetical protein [Streptomyces sp. SM11]|uniref:hypothetical protein n=1 Tax=Streptomyces sp. SM11 TaxID=565557 RepID=UPI00215662C1|nr:hypothetical protein [Streptomyces sp. SM11]